MRTSVGGKNNSVKQDNRILKDKMMLTVTDIHPDFDKKSEKETRKETAAGLYRIFHKYV